MNIMRSSPDQHSFGFLEAPSDHLRYDYLSLDSDDVGMKLSGLISHNTNILDVGCGTGVVTEYNTPQNSDHWLS